MGFTVEINASHHMAVYAYVCKNAFTIQEGCGFHDSTAQPNTVHCYSRPITFCSRLGNNFDVFLIL